MKRIIFITILFLLLFGCAAQAKPKDKKPKWLMNPKSVYPEQMYMTAIGEGDTRTQAEDYAAANLSKIFKSNVSANETYIQQYKEIVSNDIVDFEDKSDVTKSVNIQSGQTLYNIQYADSYVDELGKVSVLAYINRLQTAQIYEEKIDKNSSSIKYYLNEAQKNDDIQIKYAANNLAAVYSNDNKILMDQLEIIHSTSAEFIELEYDHNQIIRDAALYAKDIKFHIDIENDQDKKIEILLKEMFTELGFTMQTQALLYVTGSIYFNNADLNRDDFKFVRYDLQLQILDVNGSTVAALNEKGKEGHTTFSEARERAIRKINKKIDISLKKKIVGYFNNLVASQPKF